MHHVSFVDFLKILYVQATTAIVEKTVRAFYSTIAVVSTIAVICCMERSISFNLKTRERPFKSSSHSECNRDRQKKTSSCPRGFPQNLPSIQYTIITFESETDASD